MITAFGTQMSPRAERIYGWLQRRGIALHTWSTDECVAAVLPQLQTAIAVMESGGPVPDMDGTPTEIEAAARDLRAIMGRVPQNRQRV